MKSPYWLQVKNRTVNFNHIPDFELRRRRVFDELDATHFQSLVVFVAGIGFFTDGYDIFAVGMIIPMLAHVYWDGHMPSGLETAMRSSTLIGTIVGQFAFGVLADIYGRRRMYGFELLIVIVATIGVAMAADGASDSMSLVGWLVSWRFIMGVGIGGDYPLSAVITSEFAPTRSRARMIASVFYMQPCGYLMATVVTLLALVGNRHLIPNTFPTDVDNIKSCTQDELCRRGVDSAWRWVIGIGAVPAAIAILFRMSIPESPRYTMEVLNRPDQALNDVGEIGWPMISRPTRTQRDIELQRSVASSVVDRDSIIQAPQNGTLDPEPVPDRSARLSPQVAEKRRLSHRRSDLSHDCASMTDAILPVSAATSITTIEGPSHRLAADSDDDEHEAFDEDQTGQWSRFGSGFVEHFFTKGHWPTLLGTSLSWAFFDFAFYALGPNSYKVISKIFNETPLVFKGVDPLPLPTRSIYTDLLENAWHSLIIVSIGSMLGGLGMIKLTKRISPRSIQIFGFLALAVMFVAIGVCFQLVERSASVPLMALLYIITQLFFEIGPNFTTFMIPAEVFPTRLRCTAHGISAASGKIASVIVQFFVAYAPIGPLRASDPGTEWLGYVIIIFAAFMVLGAAVTKWLIPETREADGSNRPLEQLEEVAMVRRPVDCSCCCAGRRRKKQEKERSDCGAMGEEEGMPNGVHSDNIGRA
ncbi:hypothetical protein AJ80_08569 [Polytolypa hystricis UAMH7299]|uniref:Major facilitator superfamily (MFS) profile domain-containing protein n=1 Tax=Polytolypa hystricis (strain UAMH7299) TaxID=1447883 RepID=A0A2B7X5T7_POLH7|nr:hypothetical protein AJ80_08569 [Polytolypa hystricis UAMH7299]